MRLRRFCRQAFALGLAVLAIFSGAPQASAQDRHKVEIVPNIPHSEQVLLGCVFARWHQRAVGQRGQHHEGVGRAHRCPRAHLEGLFDQVRSVVVSPDGSRVPSHCVAQKGFGPCVR